MRIEEVMAPATPAVLLAEVKEHLRIDGADEDTRLNALIVAAERMIEAATGLALVSRAYNIFVEQRLENEVCYSVPVRPLIAINSIHALDAEGAETLLADSEYTVQAGLFPTIDFKRCTNGLRPCGQSGQLRINITAGFGENWNKVPADIQQALLQLVTTLYFNRGDTHSSSGDMSDLLKKSGAWAMLKPYKQVRL